MDINSIELFILCILIAWAPIGIIIFFITTRKNYRQLNRITKVQVFLGGPVLWILKLVIIIKNRRF